MGLKGVTSGDLQDFIRHCQKKAPGFDLVDGKTDSYIMNLIDGIIWPFNPEFMKRYITTLFGKVFFPDKMMLRDPEGAIEVGMHEFTHSYDEMRLTAPLYVIMYLSFLVLSIPILLAFGFMVSWVGFLPFAALLIHVSAVAISFKLRRITGFPLLILSILATIGLSIYMVGYESLWLIGVVVSLAPIPAPGRYWAELRGYGMSIHWAVWVGDRVRIERKVAQFTGPPYYFMWPFKKSVEKKLRKYEERARAGIVKDPAFLHMREFIGGLKARRS